MVIYYRFIWRQSFPMNGWSDSHVVFWKIWVVLHEGAVVSVSNPKCLSRSISKVSEQKACWWSVFSGELINHLFYWWPEVERMNVEMRHFVSHLVVFFGSVTEFLKMTTLTSSPDRCCNSRWDQHGRTKMLGTWLLISDKDFLRETLENVVLILGG